MISTAEKGGRARLPLRRVCAVIEHVPNEISPNEISPNAISPNEISPDEISPDEIRHAQAVGCERTQHLRSGMCEGTALYVLRFSCRLVRR